MKYLITAFFWIFCSLAQAETYQCEDMKYEMKGNVAKVIYPSRMIENEKYTMFCTYINGVRLDPDKDTRSDQGPLFIYTGIYDSCSMNGILMFDPIKNRVVLMSSKTLESQVLNCKRVAK